MEQLAKLSCPAPAAPSAQHGETARSAETSGPEVKPDVT